MGSLRGPSIPDGPHLHPGWTPTSIPDGPPPPSRMEVHLHPGWTPTSIPDGGQGKFANSASENAKMDPPPSRMDPHLHPGWTPTSIPDGGPPPSRMDPHLHPEWTPPQSRMEPRISYIIRLSHKRYHNLNLTVWSQAVASHTVGSRAAGAATNVSLTQYSIPPCYTHALPL
jgi:hypothetical protein